MLNVAEVSKTFFPGTVNERRALINVNLQLAAGDFVTVIGSNGAGKSTVLNTVAGRIIQDSGSVSLDGRDVSKLKEHQRAAQVGRVFQDPMAGTSPNLTIEENLALADRRGRRRGLALGVSKAKRERFAEELKVLELGLENRLKTKVGLLSGGQRQALSLLMATFSQPKVLLLDEHTAALDPQRAELVTRLTVKVVQEQELTTLMVTHNMAQALEVGNRLIMMHEGRIILDVSEQEKAKLTPEDLLAEFAKIKGAALDDKTLLQ
ncbi:ABC transporter ATP-binding protein [Nesterenkonia alkaliphila]|uniref:ATP-binding cassette domain-containing protein n=1 Tax=Nesterenkonia alkaliphila TaxID=1463631 RepID=A0A7K1UK18_9MICC|nr:ATP-binding cassette domain-containing protein [Nesterenkonia alkaliphila]MVT26754.1 ATP-binding cassette domain-containing protein [Nesterenkonia alkaliphila]GFZ77191.1 ABC transporter ATP-binding protein [Nesterenkonia alkaliphila]